MRKVEILKWETKQDGMHRRVEKVHDCYGIFHQFGIDFMEFETGPGNYTTAIIELEDGTLRNVPIDLIRFTAAEQTDLPDNILTVHATNYGDNNIQISVRSKDKELYYTDIINVSIGNSLKQDLGFFVRAITGNIKIQDFHIS